ncbi:MAG TPA: aminodeoxychorismate/anthranilate synthase component II, partial [Candidatus Poseidoniales archaeon]
PTGALGIHPMKSPNTSESIGKLGTIQSLSEAVETTAKTGVLFVDNLDSFSLNIADAIAQTGRNVTVLEGRSPQSERWLDPVALHDLLETLQPSHIVLGPGPGRPEDARLTMALAHHALAGQLKVPVLGVCLGHQALAVADGRPVTPSPHGPVHGVPVEVAHDGSGVFESQTSPMTLTRYNSLVALDDGEHSMLVNATEAASGLIMGLRHPSLNVHGVQVHPESIGSHEGHRLIARFLSG